MPFDPVSLKAEENLSPFLLRPSEEDSRRRSGNGPAALHFSRALFRRHDRMIMHIPFSPAM